MIELQQILDRVPLLLSILFIVVLTFYAPKHILQRFFFPRKHVEAEPLDESPTGEWLTAGVIYSPSFLASSEAPTIKEPATFTPYIEDYLLPIVRPKRKPFPKF